MQAMLLEHNVRFGDPECQCLMSRLESDLLLLLLAACRGSLSDVQLSWSDEVRPRLVYPSANAACTLPSLPTAAAHPGAYSVPQTGSQTLALSCHDIRDSEMQIIFKYQPGSYSSQFRYQWHWSPYDCYIPAWHSDFVS